MTEGEVRTTGRGAWKRVYIEASGREASHLSYAPFVFPLGRHAAVRMAGIGGVGTDPSFRRRGFAHRVLAQALHEIRSAGYSCVGLYTGTDIVAHRLYRRLGFVDIVTHQPAVKVLDPAAFFAHRLRRALAEAREQHADIADWHCHLAVDLLDQPSVHLRIEAGSAEAASASPARSDLTLAAPRAVLLRVWMGGMGIRFAETAGLLRWQGSPEHWRRLSTVIAAQHRVVNEGSL